MTQRNRARLEVETLEDRVTPASLSSLQSQLCALKSTVQAKIGSTWPSFSSQLSALKAKIHSVSSHTSTSSCDGHSLVHSKICSALQTAHDKLVSIGAPQSAINAVEALQVKFGC